MPGLIDTRATAACFPIACTNMDKKSFDWLENCALPAEAQCFDPNYVDKIMQKLVVSPSESELIVEIVSLN